MKIQGYVDVLQPGVVCGWIFDRDNPAKHLELDIIHRGGVLGRCVANNFRDDLKRAKIGDGCHAFTFALPVFLARSEMAQIEIRVTGAPIYLRARSPQTDASPTVSRFGGLWIDRHDWRDRLAEKRRSGNLSDEVSDAIIRFERDGYVVLSSAVPNEIVDALNQEIERFWTSPPSGLLIETFEPDGVQKYIPPDKQYRSGRTKLLDIYAFSSVARRATATPKVTAFLTALLDDKPKAFQGLTFWKGSEQRIHKDTAYVKVDTNPMHLVATWLALEDVSAGTGELIYNVGSHRAPDYLFGGTNKWMESHLEEHASFLDSLDQDVSQYGQVRDSFLGRKGDVLVWHGDLAHGGAPIVRAGSTRKSMVTHITCASDEPFYRRDSHRPVLTTDNFVFVSNYTDIHA